MWNIFKFLEIQQEINIHNIELNKTIIWYNIGLIILLGIIVFLILEIINLKIELKKQLENKNNEK